MVSSEHIEEFQKYFSRPLFTIIFRPEMLRFHPYSILTEEKWSDLSYTVKYTIKGIKIFKKTFNYSFLLQIPENNCD